MKQPHTTLQIENRGTLITYSDSAKRENGETVCHGATQSNK
jgi:hypothetical protein